MNAEVKIPPGWERFHAGDRFPKNGALRQFVAETMSWKKLSVADYAGQPVPSGPEHLFITVTAESIAKAGTSLRDAISGMYRAAEDIHNSCGDFAPFEAAYEIALTIAQAMSHTTGD